MVNAGVKGRAANVNVYDSFPLLRPAVYEKKSGTGNKYTPGFLSFPAILSFPLKKP